MGEIFEKTFHKKTGIWLLMTRCSTSFVIRKFANESRDEVKFHTHRNGCNKKDNVESSAGSGAAEPSSMAGGSASGQCHFLDQHEKFSFLNSFLISVDVGIWVRACTRERRHPRSEKRALDPLPGWFPPRTQVHLPRGGAGHSEPGPPIIRIQEDNPQMCP